MSDTSAPNAACNDCIAAVTRREWLLLAALVLLGAALRVYALARYSLWYDEGATMYASQLAEHPMRLLDPEWLTEPPLLPLVLHAWIGCLRFVGIDLTPGTYHTDYWIRLVPCLFSIASLPVAFGAARQLTKSSSIGLIATLLVAISPFQIYYAQELRPYASSTLFVVAALWFLAAAVETDKTGYWAGVTAMLAFAMYNHFFTVWYIAAFGLAICLVTAQRRRVSIKWVVSQVVLLVLIIPAIRLGFVLNSVVSLIETSWYPPLLPINGLITIKTYFAGYSPNVIVYRSLFVMGTALALAGFWAIRKRKDMTVLLIVVAFVPIAGNLVVWSLRDFAYYEHRLFIVCGIAFDIAVASGIVALRVRALRIAAVAAFIGLTLPCLRDYYAQNLHPSERHRLGVRHKVDNRDAANHIRQNLKERDVIGHFSHFTFFPLRYHYLPEATHFTLGFSEDDRRGMLASYPHLSVWEHFGGLPHHIDTVAAQYDRIWYVASWWEPSNPPTWACIYRGWLNRHAILESKSEYDGVRVDLYNTAEANLHPTVRYEQYVDAGTYATSRAIDDRGIPLATQLPYQPAPEHSLVLARDTASGEITIWNNTAVPRSIDYRIFASAEVIEPLTFSRVNPESDQWRPSLHTDPVFIDDLDPVKMSAVVSKDIESPDSLAATYRLPAGSYQVFASLWHENEPTNTSRAVLHFEFGEYKAEIEPWSANGQKGFSWRRIGAISSDGRAQHARISVALPKHLDRAYVDLGRIVFVPITGAEETNYAPAFSASIEVGADETKVLPLPNLTTHTSRRDVFVNDRATGDVRFVNWYNSVESQ